MVVKVYVSATSGNVMVEDTDFLVSPFGSIWFCDIGIPNDEPYKEHYPYNLKMKVKQDHIRRVLDSKKIPYTEIDVAAPHQVDEKVFMQKTLQLDDDDLVALPPQVFNDNKYRGDYDAFFKAIECEHLFQYLDIEVPTHEVEYTLRHG